MRQFTVSALVLALAGCTAEKGDDPIQKTETSSSLEKSPGDGFFYTVSASPLATGEYPRFIVRCEHGRVTGFQMRTVLSPSKPPPLAGTIGGFSFDGSDPQRIELGWLTADGWIARDDGRDDGSQIASRFYASSAVTFSPPAGYGLKDITWSVPAPAPEVVAACGKP